MEEQLNNLLALIEEHFNKVVWQSSPPIKEIDFQMLILSTKIVDFRNALNTIKDKDIAISGIMTFMEKAFAIPLFGTNIPAWLEQDKIRHQLILSIYNQLSNLRSI